MKEVFDVQGAADYTVQKYIHQSAGNAVQRVFEKQAGVGCQCPNCMKAVAGEANSWTQWIAPDEMDVDYLLFHYDPKTKTLYQGEHERGFTDTTTDWPDDPYFRALP